MNRVPHKGLAINKDLKNTHKKNIYIYIYIYIKIFQNFACSVLGEKFVPGSGPGQFCKPTATQVATSGVIFVADG